MGSFRRIFNTGFNGILDDIGQGGGSHSDINFKIPQGCADYPFKLDGLILKPGLHHGDQILGKLAHIDPLPIQSSIFCIIKNIEHHVPNSINHLPDDFKTFCSPARLIF